MMASVSRRTFLAVVTLILLGAAQARKGLDLSSQQPSLQKKTADDVISFKKESNIGMMQVVGNIPRGGGNDPIDTMLGTIDVAGTALFAFSGALTAGRKGMDLLGMTIIACITATGGGTTVDLLTGAKRVFWMDKAMYLQIAVTTAIATFFFWPTLEKEFGFSDSAIPICTADAIGLGAFAVLGTQKAVSRNLPPFNWIVCGLMTSTFGGVVRDVLCLQRPRVMYPERTMYAAGPLAGSIVYTLLEEFSKLDKQVITIIAFLTTVFVRINSFGKPTRLPHWKNKDW